MKIPTLILKEYIETLNKLGIEELELDITENIMLPEYCLITSEELKIVGTEVNSIDKQARYVNAKFKLQPTKIATLLIRKNNI